MIDTILFLLTLFSLQANAQEGIPCLKQDGSLGLNKLESFDCNIVRNIVQDTKLKESYESRVYDKLATALSVKISQSLEEVTLLDQFYSHHNTDLLMGNEDVKNKCRLEVIAKSECDNGVSSEKSNKKLQLLLSKFEDSNEGTLFERLYTKTLSLRTPKLKNKLQCPLLGAGGYFLLESQITEKSAAEIIKDFKMPITSKENEASNFERKLQLEALFPQLRLLKNAELAGSTDIGRNFQEYLLAYDGKNKLSQTHYLNTFFLDQKNQSQLSGGLAAQCENVTREIKQYLCEDVSHFGTTEEFAENFFGDSEDPETEIQVSKGFSCEFKDNEKNEDVKKLTEKNSIQHRFEQVNNGLRPVLTELSTKETLKPFCDMYSCKDEKIKKLNSCKAGGPLTSIDLESTYCAQYTSSTCTPNVQKAISYLKTLKDTQNIIESNQSLASDTKTYGTNDAKPRKRYSSFFENFVGVKGALKAEGRPITTATIAQKEAEFTERKLSLSSKSSSPNSSSSAIREVAQKETAQQKPQQLSPSPISSAINYEKFMKLGEAQQKEANERLKKDIIDRANSKYIAGTSDSINSSISAAKNRATSAAETERNSEIEKLRSELASVADSIKGTPEQKLATIAANNSSYEPAKSSYDPQKALNQAERERLARYRDNLDARDAELRKREFEARTSSFGRNTEAEKRQEAARAVADSANSNSSSGSGIVKLSKGSSISTVGGVSGSSDPSGKGDKGVVAEIAETDFVSSEKLATLAALKELGMEGKESFIMRVRHNTKIYEIPVKTFTYKEKKILVPLLSDKNRELAQIVFESPLFSDYQRYQLEKQQEKK